MGFLSRLQTLLKADAHGVLDAVEDRGLLVRQHLRDAESEVARKRAQGEALAAEEERLGREMARLAVRGGELDRDISLALASDKEDLAKFAIKRLLPLARSRDEMAARLPRLRAERAALAELLVEQERELDDLKIRARSFLERIRQGEDGAPFEAPCEVADEEVEIELLRRKRSLEVGETAS